MVHMVFATEMWKPPHRDNSTHGDMSTLIIEVHMATDLQQECEARQHQLRQLVWRWTLQDAAKHESGGLSVPPVLWCCLPVDVGLQSTNKQVGLATISSSTAGCSLASGRTDVWQLRTGMPSQRLLHSTSTIRVRRHRGHGAPARRAG